MSEPIPLLAPIKPQHGPPRLWQAGRFGDDPWRSIADAEGLPAGWSLLVSLTRWRGEQATLLGRGVALGVRLAAGEALDAASDAVERLSLIALPFPKFADGRSYSAARRLREAGYAGEIRATGDVLLDQLPLMLRAGFDSFEITHQASIRALEERPLPAVSRIYQTGAPVADYAWRMRG